MSDQNTAAPVAGRDGAVVAWILYILSIPSANLLVLVGLLLFVAVAAACAWFGAGWLQYPSGWAKPLILVIEAAATLSIAASLSLLVIGDETETER